MSVNAKVLGLSSLVGFQEHHLKRSKLQGSFESSEQDMDSEVENVWNPLCTHNDNLDAVQHWKRPKLLLPDPSVAPAVLGPEIVRAGENRGYIEWAASMRVRYRLCPV